MTISRINVRSRPSRPSRTGRTGAPSAGGGPLGLVATLQALGFGSLWKLDETSGTDAVDSIGSNDGVYSGGYTLAGRAGGDGGNYLNLSGGRVTIPVDPSIQPGASGFTAFALAYPTTNSGMLVANVDSGTNAGIQWAAYAGSGWRQQMAIHENADQFSPFISSELENVASGAANQWNAYGFTIATNTPTPRGRCFTNGPTQRASTQTVAAGGSWVPNTANITLGIRNMSSSGPLAGGLAMVFLGNQGISDEQMAAIMNAAAADGWISV